MNKIVLFFVTTLFIATQAFSQATTSDVFDGSKELTWLGIDYSKAQFVGPVSGWGSETTNSPDEIRDMYFNAWNNLILAEPQNFKIAEATNRSEVSMMGDAVASANKTSAKKLFVDNTSDVDDIQENELASMVKKYNIKGNGGVGMALVCEQMNKTLEQAVYWVVFVDMKSDKVLFSKKVTAKAGGFGFKNYWAGSVKAVFKTMKKEFKNWR